MNENIKLNIKKYEEIRQRLSMYYYFMNIVYWDSATVAPKMSYIQRGNNLGMLSEDLYKIRTGEEYTKTVDFLYENKDQLDPEFRHEIELIKEDIEQTKKIPMNELIEFEKLLNESQIVWEEAKNEKDFLKFKPYLQKIVEFRRKEAKYLETDKLKGYDVLLNNYERGYTQKEYDEFFGLLKEKLVPFVKKVCAANNNKLDLNKYEYNIEKQKELAKYMGDVLCFDFSRGTMGETEHPFTWNASTNDVRITNHFYKNEFSSSLFSAIHELGHALYEQNVDPKYNDTFISGGVSMAMHESQSRFYENIIGRNYNFWKNHYPKVKELYSEQLKDVSLDDFYKYVNNVELSFIRTEADELTYPLHIMLRYELERDLISGKLEVESVEEAWNQKFKEYFGLDVPNASLGILQDSHWSGGSIGYFPTYALGSAIASQLYDKMNEEFDVEKSLDSSNTKQINEWLTNKIHKFGSSKYPKEILEEALDGKFDANHYINYLKEKYSKIYNVDK